MGEKHTIPGQLYLLPACKGITIPASCGKIGYLKNKG